MGVVPSDCKIASITPIFKKGDRKKCDNYRPISLTSHIGKVIVRIIKEEIEMHLENNCLIIDNQHGFSKGKSCLTNLLVFLEKVVGIVDEGDPVDVLYLDFKKAFESPSCQTYEEI